MGFLNTVAYLDKKMTDKVFLDGTWMYFHRVITLH